MLSNTIAFLTITPRRAFSISPILYASHYDVLGLTPKATQNDIKSAYYKLSMLHHPDKSDDVESAKRFRAITEAYEVLGNLRLKKMYDKGLLIKKDSRSRTEYSPDPEPTDPTLKFYKSRMQRHVTKFDGKTPVYDFDTWSKNHYGDILKKTYREKEGLQRRQANLYKSKVSSKQESFILLVFTLVGVFGLFVVNGRDNYDIDTLHKNTDKNVTNDQ